MNLFIIHFLCIIICAYYLLCMYHKQFCITCFVCIILYWTKQIKQHFSINFITYLEQLLICFNGWNHSF